VMDNLYKFSGYAKTAYVSLTTNKLRSFLSILGIVFGIVAVILIISLGEGAKREMIRQIELLGIKNIYVRSIPREPREKNKKFAQQNGIETRDIQIIKSISEHVNAYTVIREFPPQIISVTPSFFKILDLKLFSGRPLLDQDISQNYLTAVLGYNTALALGNKASQGESIRLGNQIFKIVGILSPFGGKQSDATAISTRNLDELIIIPFGSGKWIGTQNGETDLKFEDDYISEIIIQTTFVDKVIETSDLIKTVLDQKKSNNQSYQVVTPFALLNRSKQTKDMFNFFLLSIALISLLVGGIGIMNIMLATVSERKKEIGIRRSIGAKKRNILVQFLTESILLTVIGGVAGIILGAISVLIMGKIAPWPVTLSPVAILLPLIISSMTGICSGIYPAAKAAEMDPVEALNS